MALTTLETVLSALQTALQNDSTLSSSTYNPTATPLIVAIVRQAPDLTSTTWTKYLITLFGTGIREERRIGRWMRRYFSVEIGCYQKTVEKGGGRLFGVGATKGIQEFAQAVHDALLGNLLSSTVERQPISEIRDMRFVDTQNTNVTAAILQWQGMKNEQAP